MDESRLPTLELGQKQIRVIWILPDQPDGVIRCRMATVPLDSQHIALSYVWGEDNPIHRIEINGKSFYVRQNLHNFLCHARTVYAGELLWIDAICINQRNIKERNHQVRQMGHVYSSAQAVVSWLGCGDAELEGWLSQDSSVSLPKVSNKHGMEAFLDNATNDLILNNLTVISELDYWDRLWIVPEVLGARKLQLLYGYQSLSWADLGTILNYISSKSDMLNKSQAQKLREIKSSRMNTFVQERLADAERIQQYSLQVLLTSYGMNACSDKRDRVFALITLAGDVDTTQIDYNESAEALCVRILGLQKMTISELCPFAMYLMSILGLDSHPCWPLVATDLTVPLSIPLPVKQVCHPLRKKDSRWREIHRAVSILKGRAPKPHALDFQEWLKINNFELFETIGLDALFTIVTEWEGSAKPRRVLCIIRQFVYRASPELSTERQNSVYRVPGFGLLHGTDKGAYLKLPKWISLQLCFNIFNVTPIKSQRKASKAILSRGFQRRPFDFDLSPFDRPEKYAFPSDDARWPSNWGFRQPRQYC